MSFRTKVYIVQRADREGKLIGEIPVAVKLTYEDAAMIARKFAPARVTMLFADKTNVANGPGQIGHQDYRLPPENDSKGDG